MERSEDLCCKFNIFDYLPSKNSFLGLFCSNTHKMFFFAKMLSFHISGICCFRPGGKVAESKSSERLYFSASGRMLATDTVNVGWVRAILTMPTGRKSGIKEERKKKEMRHFGCPEMALGCVFADIDTFQSSQCWKGNFRWLFWNGPENVFHHH